MRACAARAALCAERRFCTMLCLMFDATGQKITRRAKRY
jgi:hypothetical protein